MFPRQQIEYYVYLTSGNEKDFLGSVFADSPHQAKQLVWSKFEPEIKRKNPEAKVKHLFVETINNQIFTK